MKSINIEELHNNFSNILMTCLSEDEVFKVHLGDDNAILMSEAHYMSLIESIYLRACGVYDDIKEVNNTPTSKLIKDVID